MALPPAALAQLGAVINAVLAGQVATTADINAAVAPLATQAQLAAAVAPLATQTQLQAQLAAMQAATQVQLAAMQAATQVQLAAMQAQILAQMQLLLAPVNVPAIAAVASASVAAIAAARARNAHDRSGEPYAAVPCADGTLPPSWPAGFERSALVSGPIAVIDALLNDYGMPNGAPAAVIVRRNALAQRIGTTLV